MPPTSGESSRIFKFVAIHHCITNFTIQLCEENFVDFISFDLISTTKYIYYCTVVAQNVVKHQKYILWWLVIITWD